MSLQDSPGPGPWFVALLTAKDRKKVIVDTYAHKAADSDWKILQVVGPFLKLRDAQIFGRNIHNDKMYKVKKWVAKH